MEENLYTKNELLIEGKTKRIWSCKNNPEMIVIENKSSITAFDDPSKTKEFEAKARYATNTTCRVFELLKQAGIPVAFEKQLSETEFLAPRCTMIPLEVIARRYAVGSYLKRFPEMSSDANNPDRFHSLKTEFFLKTTGGELELSGKKIVEGLNPKEVEEDPLIIPTAEGVWGLYHSKIPSNDFRAFLGLMVKPRDVIVSDPVFKASGFESSSDPEYYAEIFASHIAILIEEVARKVFIILESAWEKQGIRLIDFKIEFGFTTKNKLVVADVIDNDSWRLRTKNWTELSKESFRQGEDLGEVEEKYGIVSQMANNLSLFKE